jgi:hypothetical protein
MVTGHPVDSRASRAILDAHGAIRALGLLYTRHD